MRPTVGVGWALVGWALLSPRLDSRGLRGESSFPLLGSTRDLEGRRQRKGKVSDLWEENKYGEGIDPRSFPARVRPGRPALGSKCKKAKLRQRPLVPPGQNTSPSTPPLPPLPLVPPTLSRSEGPGESLRLTPTLQPPTSHQSWEAQEWTRRLELSFMKFSFTRSSPGHAQQHHLARVGPGHAPLGR